MAYREDEYNFENSNEYEYGFSGKFGKKDERRAPRKKRTELQIQKQNQWIRKKTVRRKAELNFRELESHFVTLTYRREERPSDIETVEKHKKRFLEAMRKEYKKAGVEFKWIMRIEIGKKGAVHMHILLNDIPGTDMGKLIAKKWKYGRPKTEVVDDLTSGKLADYLTKLPDDINEGQMTFLTAKERGAFIRYSCSRNLEKPVPKRKTCSRRTVEKMIRDGIEPTKGYYIDKDSVRYGINPFTGYSYLYYKEIKCRRGETGERATVPEQIYAPPWEKEEYGEQEERDEERREGEDRPCKPLYRVFIQKPETNAWLVWMGGGYDMPGQQGKLE